MEGAAVSLAGLMTRTLTVTNRTQSGTTGRTNVPGWVDAASFDVQCYFEQNKAIEDVTGRQTQIVDGFAVVGPGVRISPSARVQVDGVVYEVIGKPNQVHTPSGEHHVEVMLENVEG